MTTNDLKRIVNTDNEKATPNNFTRYNEDGILEVPYLTTAPTADNPNGLIFVVLSAEPATYYNGYYYIITEAEG